MKVIDHKPYSAVAGDQHLSVVLREVSGPQPYATHLHNAEDNGYFHGHYFDTEIEARDDFNKRK